MAAPEEVLAGAPALGPLYAKAALGAVLPGDRARAVPDRTLVREDVAVDVEHLAAYARVSGFALDGPLPLTYPHVLAFGLQIALMADRSFPLPLPGLVHVRNRIVAARAIDPGERLRVAVHAENLAAHPKGAQVDLVAHVDSGGERVWSGRSTYLARGAHAPEGEPATGPEPPAVTGGPPSVVWRVPDDAGRRYARVSGDVNPIHLHPLTARAFGFPRAIAHGMWTAARAVAALQGRLPGAATFDVVFGKPVLLPSTVELRTRPVADGWGLSVAARSGAEHLRAVVRAG
ncbi:MaoC family dehydratase [Pseudonocardia sp. H11422]|uniref:MaoC family dehydratase n=1 Tax=Pseudonocardia sp. H11422 TaxID=2835866 RepID=UPI001BDD68FB|nr:MaoC/PaaZ C-terminal domain-containing protein [Pseudonocardia sp. H11422]